MTATPKRFSLRRLARELDVTEASVRKGIKSERLKHSVGYDERKRPFIASIKAAVGEWKRNATLRSVTQIVARNGRRVARPGADPVPHPNKGSQLAPTADDPPVLIFSAGGGEPVPARGMSVFSVSGWIVIVAGFIDDDNAHRIIKIDQSTALMLSESLLRAVLEIQQFGRDDIANAEHELAEAAKTMN